MKDLGEGRIVVSRFVWMDRGDVVVVFKYEEGERRLGGDVVVAGDEGFDYRITYGDPGNSYDCYDFEIELN